MDNQSKFSVTQLTNFAGAFGLLVIFLGHFGIVVSSDQLTFIVAAVWTIGSQVISYINRYKAGNVTVLGARK